MKKIGFVAPWFGMDIQGGAEMELRELVLHLKSTNLQFEVLTTCIKSFNSDWNKNYYKPGEYKENGISVRRFLADKRNTGLFDQINAKLMHGQSITRSEEETFMQEMVNSSSLYEYMSAHDNEYSLFVFIPYMFGTTYYGVKVNPQKAVLIPCFHDESYFHMSIFKETFSKVAGIVYNAKPEQELTEKCYDVSNVKQVVMGLGMNTEISGNAECFRKKYQIEKPFVLYAGRKDAGKNVDTLLKYFSEYHKRNISELELVLIGGGTIDIPENVTEKVHDLGFVDVQDKYDACAAAELLCQPSTHESFSIVIMESWLCGRPVLVHERCAVTKNFATESQGGLYFKDYFEFEGCINYYLEHGDIANRMGQNGKEYVRNHFAWDVIIEKYLQFFESMMEEK